MTQVVVVAVVVVTVPVVVDDVHVPHFTGHRRPMSSPAMFARLHSAASIELHAAASSSPLQLAVAVDVVEVAVVVVVVVVMVVEVVEVVVHVPQSAGQSSSKSFPNTDSLAAKVQRPRVYGAHSTGSTMPEQLAEVVVVVPVVVEVDDVVEGQVSHIIGQRSVRPLPNWLSPQRFFPKSKQMSASTAPLQFAVVVTVVSVAVVAVAVVAVVVFVVVVVGHVSQSTGHVRTISKISNAGSVQKTASEAVQTTGSILSWQVSVVVVNVVTVVVVVVVVVTVFVSVVDVLDRVVVDDVSTQVLHITLH